MSIENLAKNASEFQTNSNDIARINEVKGNQFDPDKLIDVNAETNQDNFDNFDPDKLIGSEIQEFSDNELGEESLLHEEFDPDVLVSQEELEFEQRLDDSIDPESHHNDENYDSISDGMVYVNEEIRPETYVDEIGAMWKEYVEKMKNLSEYKDDIDDSLLDVIPERVDPQVVDNLREEFSMSKNRLIREWETLNHREWPKYENDVYTMSKTGELTLIRRAGDRYDAHHKQPLCMGGKNDASNITPMHAAEHFDHKGVHDGPYAKLLIGLEVKL